jgi:hypothetical protein
MVVAPQPIPPKKYATMIKNNVVAWSGRETNRGAKFAARRDARRRVAVARNSDQPEREIQNGISLVAVKVSRVRSRTGGAVSFRSALVSPARVRQRPLTWLSSKFSTLWDRTIEPRRIQFEPVSNQNLHPAACKLWRSPLCRIVRHRTCVLTRLELRS